jgi:hypothetical protein
MFPEKCANLQYLGTSTTASKAIPTHLLTYQFQILIKLVNARKLNYEQIIAA